MADYMAVGRRPQFPLAALGVRGFPTQGKFVVNCYGTISNGLPYVHSKYQKKRDKKLFKERIVRNF